MSNDGDYGLYCPMCVNDLRLGDPSYARWVDPNGGPPLCSLHYVRLYGHGERMVRIDGYEPPRSRVAPPPHDPGPVVAPVDDKSPFAVTA